MDTRYNLTSFRRVLFYDDKVEALVMMLQQQRHNTHSRQVHLTLLAPYFDSEAPQSQCGGLAARRTLALRQRLAIPKVFESWAYIWPKGDNSLALPQLSNFWRCALHRGSLSYHKLKQGEKKSRMTQRRIQLFLLSCSSRQRRRHWHLRLAPHRFLLGHRNRHAAIFPMCLFQGKHNCT